MAGDGLYLAAAQILFKVSEGKGAVRTLCYASSIQNKKALYGLVLETARHLNLFKRIIQQSSWLELANKNRKALPRNLKRIDDFLAATLLQDFLFATLKCGSELKSLVEGSKSRLRSELVRAQIHFKKLALPEGISADSEEDHVPRYVRVNRCLVPQDTTDLLISELAAFTKLAFPKDFFWDTHVNDLLVFPPNTDLISSKAYRNNHIILQDKASCFPPQILMPPLGAKVIDACAAPGNKTSQLCALVGPTGHVFAFERDSRRFETLKKLTDQALAHETPSRLTCLHADFLSIDPNDPKYADVEYVLCDPSCSGSGMPMSLERNLSNSNNNNNNNNNNANDQSDRLEQLSKFQCTILRHAAQFPALKKLVYSTCSIHEIENEFVVSEVLKSCPHLKLSENVLPEWKRRGLDSFDFGKLLIRASSKEDQMNGFFVALFEQK